MEELPYVGKRIKQNLQGINFDDDSEDDEDWIKQSEVDNDASISLMTLQSSGPRKRLPRRRVAPNNFCEDAADEDLGGDSD